MASYDNSYSRFILWAKIILPLLALAILSTVFLLARPVDPSKAIPYARVDVKELVREKGITAPNYSGVTRDGAAISVSAQSAKPDKKVGNEALIAEGFHAEIELPDGAVIRISSDEGSLDNRAQTASLMGDVSITNSIGYVVKSERVDASLLDARFASDEPVSAVGPAGKITAGSLELIHRNQNYLLVFKNGVKLIYDPKG